MRRFFDVYIRRADTPFAAFVLTTNMLAGADADWDRLELPTDKPKITLENEVAPLGTGVDLTISEKLSVEAGTMDVTKAEYDYLRASFHNQRCDFLFYDPNDDAFLVAAFGIVPQVVLLLESGANCTIQISGSRLTGIEATSKLLIGSNTYACLISGQVLMANGKDPVFGAEVTVTLGSPARDYADTTDKDGNYQMMVEVPQSTATTATVKSCVKAGLAFTLPGAIDVARNGEYSINILATT